MRMEEKNLRPYNKFGLDCITNKYFRFFDITEIEHLAAEIPLSKNNFFILGGGSNVLLPENLDRIVLHPCNDRIDIISDNNNRLIVRAHAGLEWDRFVDHCVSKNWAGLENLSLIPGNVGAAPVQNIGAYGKEVCETIEKVTCYNLFTKQIIVLENSDCEFSYRDSIFKRRPELLVLSVDFELFHSRNSALRNPNGNRRSYRDFLKEINRIVLFIFSEVTIGPKTSWKPKISFENVRSLLQSNLLSISLKRKLVCLIRKKTMPDPTDIGNVGCFFKSPIVKKSAAISLKSLYPKIAIYPDTPDTYKVSAGDLIRECGWAGIRIGDVSINERRPLIILNHGKATSKEILEFSKSIQSSVFSKFNINIDPEVVIVK
ncbi:FAD-binding protein [Pseudomonas sp. YH-1]|uniref:FAD-binding protein n=1 Tax=Pseudomonas sp. YH-1 TaxID=3384787 RepID=UPI003F7D46A7